MPCKVCGRPRPINEFRHYNNVNGIIEPLCWRCKVWATTGYVMPERRH